MARTCECPKPPGGSITCSDHQLAMCGYRGGVIVSGCFDPPPSVAAMRTKEQQFLALHNWSLQEITGISRALTQSISDDDRAILNSGEYLSASGQKVTFVLPAKIKATSEGGASAVSYGA